MAYTAPLNKYHIDADSGKIYADGELRNKVTGTSMGGILGVSPWSTEFTVACHLLGLGREDISDKPAVRRGVALEEKIIRYADKAYPQIGQFMTEKVAGFKDRTGDHDTWASDFEDEIFAGHVDGIVSRDGEDYILEVKTSANLDSWINGVPEYYFWQVALYNHFLTKQDKAYVLLGIANENTDRDPASWIANENTVKLYTVDIDQEMVSEAVERVKEWYQTNIIDEGATPVYDPNNSKDKELWDHLSAISTSVVGIRQMLDEYMEITEAIDEHNNKIVDLLTRQQELKDTIKDYMIHNKVTSMDSVSGEYIGRISTRKSARIAEERMVADGIDPAKYKIETETKAFSAKLIRK